MRKKYKVNNMLNLLIITAAIPFGVLSVMLAWNQSTVFGIICTLIMSGVLFVVGPLIYLNPKNIKSVTVTSDSLVIDYRKTSAEVFYKDIKKIEHYKHGLFTERIWIYTSSATYEIIYDIKDFQNMCKNIYSELSKHRMENITDEWFQTDFGGRIPYEKHPFERNADDTNKYTANFPLIWTLMTVQFFVVLYLIIFLWTRPNVILNIVITVTYIFIEYGGILAITSPKITQSVSINASSIFIGFKKERVEIPLSSIQMVSYQRPWIKPKRVYIVTKQMQCILLPWYIKNFRGMCKSIYKALKKGQIESKFDKVFLRKFGK